MNTRRQFLIQAPVALLAIAGACRDVQKPATPVAGTGTPAPGAPPTFGTAAGSGPPVTPATFAEAEKLAQVTFTPAQRQQASDSWRGSMTPYLERRTGPRKVALGATDVPGTLWNPMLPGVAGGPSRDRFVRSMSNTTVRPSTDDAIAFAPVTHPLAMDRVEATHVDTADEHLPESNRKAQSEDQRHHHAHEGSRARARGAGRPGDRGREVPRAAARHSVWREGPARHGRHCHDLGR